jgi:hypothetical protein
MDMGFKVQQTRQNIKEAPTGWEEIAADVPGIASLKPNSHCSLVPI